MQIVSLMSTKGGVGRTTSAIILGSTLAARHRVTLVDADPAKDLIAWSRKAPLPRRLKVFEPADDIPIHEVIEMACYESDFVIIDTAAELSKDNEDVFHESTLVVIPMGDEQLDGEKATEMLARMRSLPGEEPWEVPARVLFNRTQCQPKLAHEDTVNKKFRSYGTCFDVELHRRQAYSQIHELGGTLYQMNPDLVEQLDPAIHDAELLVKELLRLSGASRSRAKRGQA